MTETMTAIAAIEISAPCLSSIATEDIDAFRPARKAEGLSAVTVNHDLKLLRKMLNWGIRRGYLQRTPFKGAPKAPSHCNGRFLATGGSRARLTNRSCSMQRIRTFEQFSLRYWIRLLDLVKSSLFNGRM